MIEKLRSRTPIDIAAPKWRKSWLLGLILGGLAAGFVLGPLGGAALSGLLRDGVGGLGALVVAGAVAGAALFFAAIFVRLYRTNA